MAKSTTPSDADRVAVLEAEVSALKKRRIDERKKIVEVATKYAQRHSMCDVVNQALREAGLFGDTEKIQVTATVDLAVVVEVDKETWENLTEDERTQMLSKAGISGINWNPGGATVITGIAYGNQKTSAPVITKADVTVTGATDAPATVKAFDAVSAKSQYDWLFTSDDGRVQHAVRRDARGGLATTAICGISSGGGFYGTTWARHSSRSENRRCPRCVASYDKLD